MKNKTIIWMLVFLICLVPVMATSYNTTVSEGMAANGGDTYVWIDAPTTNYGTSDTLQGWDDGGDRKQTFIFWNMTEEMGDVTFANNITLAQIYIYKFTGIATTLDIFQICNDYMNESSLTWNGVIGGAVSNFVAITGQSSGAINAWTELNITESVYNETINDDGQFTMRLATDGYTSYRSKEYTTNTSMHPYLYVEYTIDNETVNIRTYNENSGEVISGRSITYILDGQTSGSSSTGYYQFENVSTGQHEIRVVDTTGSRTYIINKTANEYFLDAYLINQLEDGVQAVTFTVIDAAEGKVVDGVQMVISRYIDGSYTSITTQETDIAGNIVIYLDSDVKYYFNLSKESYINKDFDLSPSATNYDILLYQDLYLTFNDTQGDVEYLINPYSGVLATNDSSNFTINTSSSAGYIFNFGSWAVIDGTTYIDNQTGATGGVSVLELNTTGLEDTTLNVHYFMQTQGGFIQINKSYYLVDNAYEANQSLSQSLSSYADEINPLYRYFIALFCALIVGAAFFTLLGTAGATIITWIVFAGFAVVGFVNWTFPIIAGILITLGYVVLGGNEGT